MNILFLLSTLVGLNTSTHKLTVDITHLEDPEGQLIVMIYKPENEFLSLEAYKVIKIDLDDSSPSVDLDLPSGEYSVFVAHDKNRDGEVNRNMFGIPKEGIGVSNHELGLSKPSFEECSLQLQSNKKVVVKMVYY